MANQTFKTLIQRLTMAGFRKEFVFRAILPDWWDDSCFEDPRLLQDLEIRVARFLGLQLEAVTNARSTLTMPLYPAAQLRRVREVNRDRLSPAIHSAMRIAEAVVRNLRDRNRTVEMPPTDALAWRHLLTDPTGANVNLEKIIPDLWNRGIPVVPIDLLPTPSFQGMACIAEHRPVVLLGHKHDEPGRVAFLVAHEIEHVVAGDCAPDQPVVDEEEEIPDQADLEVAADQYATRLLIGSDTVPELDGRNFKEIAQKASEVQSQTGADASAVIFSWARQTLDYQTATMAVTALYRHRGARQYLRELFDQHVDLSGAPETDRTLLRCVYADTEPDDAVG